MPRRDHFKRVQRRRYQSRSYKNPHLADRKRFNWKQLSAVFGGIVAVVAATAFLLGHPVFAITNVHIDGVEYSSRPELEETISGYMHESRYLVFHHTNRFLFSSEELSDLLMNTFALASIEIGLQEGQIFVNLEERTSNLFWKTDGRLYVVDLEGIVVREVKDDQDDILQQSNLAELPIIIDVNNIEVDVGSRVLTQNEVEQAFAFLDSLESAGIPQEYVEIDRIAGKWVRVVTTVGFSVLIDLAGDIEEQLAHLLVVLGSEVEDHSTLDYVDLRFGDKVYYK